MTAPACMSRGNIHTVDNKHMFIFPNALFEIHFRNLYSDLNMLHVLCKVHYIKKATFKQTTNCVPTIFGNSPTHGNK